MASSLERLIFDIIARDKGASAAFDRFRRSIDQSSGSLDSNTKSLQQNSKVQTSALGGAVGLGIAFSAMASPLAAAGAGFTAFAAIAVPSISKINKAFTGPGGLQANLGTLDAGQRKVALSVQALGRDYGQLAKQMEPQVFQVLNTGIAEASKLLGPFDRLAAAGAKGTEDFLAQFTTGSGLSQFITFLSKEAAPALHLIGQDVTSVSHAVFSLLESFGGLGMAELKAFTAVLTGVSNSISWLAQHAPGITSVSIALGGLALALSKFGLLVSVAKLTGISAIAGQMAGFAAATKGATIAEKGLLATTTAMEAITPFGWAILAAAALGGLAFALSRINGPSGIQATIDQMAKQDHATGLNVAGYAKLSAALKDTTARITDQQNAGIILSTNTAHLVAQQDALTSAQVKASATARNLHADFADLGSTYGLTVDQAKTLIVKSGSLNDILANNGKITPATAEKLRAWAETENKATGQTNTMAIAVKSLTDAMQKNIGAVLTLQGDQNAYQVQLIATNKQLRSNSAGLRGNSSDAVTNRGQIIALTNSAMTFASAQLTVHGNLKLASQEIQSQIDWLQKHGDKTKFARDEIHALLAEEAKIKAQIGTNIVVHGSGSWTVLPSGKHIPTGAGGMATGGRVPGYGGGDKWPALLEGGEAIVPKHLVPQLAPFLKAHGVPGFAAGGVMDSYGNGVTGLTGWLATENAATVKAVQQATASAIFAAIRSPAAGFSGSGPGGPVEAVARALFPWAASQWPSFNYVEMREAGYNLTARNPTSGAYGVAQFINGPAEYFQWGGNPFTAAGQFTAMFNYIASRYVTPAAAAQHEQQFNWYGSGLRNGYFSRPTLIGVGENGPERVNVTPVGGDDTNRQLGVIIGLLGELIGAVDDNARTTAAGVSRAFGGASRAAMHGALYSAR